MTDTPTPEVYLGRTVVDPAGNKIGSVGQVYVDDDSGVPDWVTINTGLFGMRENFVPLQGSSLSGDQLQVAFDKDVVSRAPGIDDDSHLDADEEQNLYTYYEPFRGGGRSSTVDSDYRTVSDVRSVSTVSPGSVAADEGPSTDRTDVPEAMAADAGQSSDRIDGGQSMAADAGTATDRTDSGQSLAADAGYATDRTDSGQSMAADAGTATDRADSGQSMAAGPNTPAPEERRQVGHERGAGRARLRRYVDTEQQPVRVALAAEEIGDSSGR